MTDDAAGVVKGNLEGLTYDYLAKTALNGVSPRIIAEALKRMAEEWAAKPERAI